MVSCFRCWSNWSRQKSDVMKARVCQPKVDAKNIGVSVYLCMPNIVRGQKPVLGTGTEGVIPNDLARIIDAVGGGSKAAGGIDRRVDTAAVEEGVLCGNRTVATAFVKPDDLSLGVDALWDGD